MADLLFDFSDSNKAKLFPQHGWATNSQGIKILWCPLVRLLQFPNRTLQEKGKSGKSHPGIAHSSLAFAATLKNLAITLRELHQVTRLSCGHPVNLDPVTLTADHRAFEMAPLYIDLTFSYLRRIADLLVMACSPLLFEHWQSVPQKFKNWGTNVSQLKTHRPLCDFTVLHEAVVNHSGWFNELRGTSPLTRKKGIRDALEHRPVRFLLGKQQTGNNRPRFKITLDSRAGDVEIHKDILPRITESVAGLCHLMTGIHSAISVGSKYEWGAQMAIVGDDDDIVGYWPKIGA